MTDRSTPTRREAWTRGILLGVCTAWLGAPVVAQELVLAESVPSDAFMYYRWHSVPEADFIRDANRKAFEALIEADFGGMLVDEIAPTFASGEDLEQIRGVHALVEQLLGAVPWGGLCEHEVVMGLRQHAPDMKEAVGVGSDFQVFAGATVDRDVLGPSYASLTRILATIEQIKPEAIELLVVVDDGEAERELGGVEALVDAQRYLGTDAGVMCHLSVLMDDGFSGYGRKNVASLLFVEDKVCMTAARGADAMARDALASMRGRRPCLAGSERLEQAFEGLPDGFEEVYFDTAVMLEPMRRTLEMAAGGRSFGSDAMSRDPEIAMWSDVFSLLDCWGATAGRTYVEDGRQVNESVVRFRDDPAARNNPFYLSATSPNVGDTSDLLGFVPADALGFTVHEGFDLVPFYDWALERVATYVPDADRILPLYGAAQGVLGIDVRDELLPLIGSPSVQVTVPKQSRGMGQPETVIVSRPNRLEASRDFERRIVQVAESLLPLAMDEIGPQLKQQGARLSVRLGPNDGAYRTLHQLEISGGFGPIGGGTSILFGHVGPMQVVSTSEEAISYVLETYAGEYASVLEEGPLVELGALPEGKVAMISMTDIGSTLEEAAVGLMQAGAMMPGMMQTNGNSEQERTARVMMTAVGGTLRRIGQVYGQMDHLGRSVMMTRVGDDGASVFSKTVLEFRDDGD